MITPHIDQIGGAIVRRRVLTIAGKEVSPGTILDRQTLVDMPTPTRNALITQNLLEVIGRGSEPEPSKRHLVNAGFGKFDVIEGVKLNEHSMTKEEAEALIAETASAVN